MEPLPKQAKHMALDRFHLELVAQKQQRICPILFGLNTSILTLILIFFVNKFSFYFSVGIHLVTEICTKHFIIQDY